jgi:hypothetical protein
MTLDCGYRAVMSHTAEASTHGGSHVGKPTAVAEYPDVQHARTAIERLEAHGVDGDDIVILATRKPGRVSAEDVADADRATSRYTALWIILGAVVGTLAGALIGAALIGLVVLLWPSGLPHEGWAWGLGTAFVAAAGAVVGGFIALSRKSGFSDAWADSFIAPEADERDSPVRLAVFGDRDRADRAIETTEPTTVDFEPDMVVVPPAS